MVESRQQLSLYSIGGYDPTRTLTLRNIFASEMAKKFGRLTTTVRRVIVDDDVFGRNESSGGHRSLVTGAQTASPGWRAFALPTAADQLEAFDRWFGEQIDAILLETTTNVYFGRAMTRSWINQYSAAGYQRGVLRARQELLNNGWPVPSVEDGGGIPSIIGHPFHLDRMSFAHSRARSELKSIVASMQQQVVRVLSQVIGGDKTPNELGRLVVRTISGPVGDLGITDTLGRFIPAQRRAQILARTEIIRAHHFASIQEYRIWGVPRTGVIAEHTSTASGDDCRKCSPLELKSFSLDEIEFMIPLHPECRCFAIPVAYKEVQNALDSGGRGETQEGVVGGAEATLGSSSQ